MTFRAGRAVGYLAIAASATLAASRSIGCPESLERGGARLRMRRRVEASSASPA